jgi:hypothetical protein
MLKLSHGFRLLLVGFWFLWILLVSLADSVDFFLFFFPENKALSLFTSNNMSLVKSFWAHYHIVCPQVILLSYFLILIFCWACTAAFCVATLHVYKNRCVQVLSVHLAFWSLAVFHFFFILSDEIFFQYEHEHIHLMRLGVIILNYFLYVLLSESKLFSKKRP